MGKKKRPVPALIAPDKIAMEKWVELQPILDHLGQSATQLDVDNLTTYSKAWSNYLRAEELLLSEGFVTTSKAGGERKHPAFQISKDCTDTMNRCRYLISKKLKDVPAGEGEASPFEDLLS